MGTCFVIQPFDNGGPFDKRFKEVFKPAIEDTKKLNAYRVDEDPTVDDIVAGIHEGIRSAEVCLADITLDNPNVWYELGYSLGKGKRVVMVCSDERAEGPYPFDISHRHIIRYKTESSSDFDALRAKITERLVQNVEQAEQMAQIRDTVAPTQEYDGLTKYELSALIAIAEGSDDLTPGSVVTPFEIKNSLAEAGFNTMAAVAALRGLLDKELINRMHGHEMDEYSQDGFGLTDTGAKWVMANIDKINLKWEPAPEPERDDFPF